VKNINSDQEYTFENNGELKFENNEWAEVAVWKENAVDVLPGKL
jgi:hypothetical protein